MEGASDVEAAGSDSGQPKKTGDRREPPPTSGPKRKAEPEPVISNDGPRSSCRSIWEASDHAGIAKRHSNEWRFVFLEEIGENRRGDVTSRDPPEVSHGGHLQPGPTRCSIRFADPAVDASPREG